MRMFVLSPQNSLFFQPLHVIPTTPLLFLRDFFPTLLISSFVFVGVFVRLISSNLSVCPNASAPAV